MAEDQEADDWLEGGEAESDSEGPAITASLTAKGELVNRSKLISILGVAPATVDKWIKDGMPIAQKGNRRLGYRFNTAAVITWIRQRDVALATGSADAISFDASKAREMEARAKLREIELERKSGEFIHVDAAADNYVNRLGVVRSRLMAIPGRVAQPLSLVSDPAEVGDVVRHEIDDALTDLVKGGEPEVWHGLARATAEG